MKKKFLIMAGLLLSLCLIVGCKKEEPIEQDANYAVNGGEQTTVTEEIDVEDEQVGPTLIEEESEEPEVTEDTSDFHITHDYEGEADINEGNKELTNTNISIDGKILSYPATIDQVINTFGTLTDYDENELSTTNYSIDSMYYVKNIDSGYGRIGFKFDNDGNTSYITCSGEAYNGETSMTVALPTKIRFGSTIEQVEEAYKDYKKVNSEDYDNGGYKRTYAFENAISKGEVDFVINDYGVNCITIIFR